MWYLDLGEVLQLHAAVLESSGGASGVRDRGGLESTIAQPRMAFGGQDLYPSLAEKAAAHCFSIVSNHPLVDGNKRSGQIHCRTKFLNSYRSILGHPTHLHDNLADEIKLK